MPKDDQVQLTSKEKALLKKWLRFYRALEDGRIPANNNQRRHFVAVCLGKAQPENAHETAYLKHRALSDQDKLKHRKGEGTSAKARGQITVTVNGRKIKFTSPYSDGEAISVLKGLIARGRVISSFADDLLQKTEKRQQLSRNQLDWVHKLVSDSEDRSRNRSGKLITGQTRKPGSHRWSHPGS